MRLSSVGQNLGLERNLDNLLPLFLSAEEVWPTCARRAVPSHDAPMTMALLPTRHQQTLPSPPPRHARGERPWNVSLPCEHGGARRPHTRAGGGVGFRAYHCVGGGSM